MGARKNNPNKFGVSPDNRAKFSPVDAVQDFSSQEGFRIRRVDGKVDAWEIFRGDIIEEFECALLCFDPRSSRWSIALNGISDKFVHASPKAAWDWFASLSKTKR
jgi:hypothetical protein